MTFGLRVRDESGAIILDNEDFTYEVIFNTTLDWTGTAGQALTQTYTIDGFDPETCVFVIFLETPGAYNPASGYNYPGIPYMYPPSGNQITIRSATPNNTQNPTYAAGLYRIMAFRML
ncbi:hypothetical protein [Azorhizophilus paspali]|uniref:Uncharacterized protein n=1 Tax=Azorhizophilus paspali TaxID=69963 RepID=A0ABV6SNQ8_AZOPA